MTAANPSPLTPSARQRRARTAIAAARDLSALRPSGEVLARRLALKSPRASVGSPHRY